jgi:ribonuclease E
MSEAKNEMVINYVPGEECRVAVVEEGKLEEFHAERADAVSHVGNIYVGKVKNVEPAIQAAFVDFGLEQNGFLHVSDLHPQYFPGEGDETTEMVGKKTPRRERPPIQECLRRGQEIAVQVLKEGVGTKGPTVTSYLSIPGRFLVMMPSMDRVGVSRKVEDEETRRKMREILDQLELPDGFGFIVRTAGMERTKAELKRDLAYLARLWKDIEKRWGKGGNKPRLLYSESDLLMRALRDMVTTDLDRIVIDDESAMLRAARFLKIVAPRTNTKLVRYVGKTPIFHAMGIEEQIRTMYSREVPLPSGGRLVIDETEALVAIDVNSGKMRDARDAETNAYRTNLEAADEICRQLKLRDVGGIVVNDLIDMRSLKHRREIEHKFKELLKKDRARTTLEQISEFGILEMTRQRMRGSYESVHFADCPICRGRGLVQRPDSVAADAMRELAALLEHERVARIEMAVSPRIAGELLSSKRRALNRLERSSGKHVEVRVSESVPVDRVTFYCYDDRGADIDTTRIALPRAKKDELVPFDLTTKSDEDWAQDAEQEAKAAMAIEPPEPEPVHEPAPDAFLDALERDEAMAAADSESGEVGEGPGDKRRRRRRGRGRGRGRDGEGAQTPPPAPAHGVRPAPARPEEPGERAPRPEEGEPRHGDEEREGGRRRRRRRRGRGRGRGGQMGEPMAPGVPPLTGREAEGTPIFDEEGMPTAEEEVAEPVTLSAEPSSWDLEVSAAHSAGELAPEQAEPAEDFENTGLPHEQEAVEPRGEAAGPTEGGSGPGAPGPDDERRGRRRRRRRGRGRGRGGEREGMNGGAGAPLTDQHPPEEPAGAPGEPEEHAMGQGAASEEEAWDGAAHEETPPETGGESVDSSGEQRQNGDQERRGGRRRRRRGRGRGRGGDGGGGGGGGGGDARGGRRETESGHHRPRDERAGPPQPRQAPPPARSEQRPTSPPRQNTGNRGMAPASTPMPTPRVLYSSRRKLSPSERGKIKPE